jgi:hypothetical protein
MGKPDQMIDVHELPPSRYGGISFYLHHNTITFLMKFVPGYNINLNLAGNHSPLPQPFQCVNSNALILMNYIGSSWIDVKYGLDHRFGRFAE